MPRGILAYSRMGCFNITITASKNNRLNLGEYMFFFSIVVIVVVVVGFIVVISGSYMFSKDGY